MLPMLILLLLRQIKRNIDDFHVLFDVLFEFIHDFKDFLLHADNVFSEFFGSSFVLFSELLSLLLSFFVVVVDDGVLVCDFVLFTSSVGYELQQLVLFSGFSEVEALILAKFGVLRVFVVVQRLISSILVFFAVDHFLKAI